MFEDAVSFDPDIGQWDVAQSTDFRGMFARARSFNQNIDKWNVSKGTTFANMFQGANSFDQDIGYWNVSRSISFVSMFKNADIFNQDIGRWDVSRATQFNGMFENAGNFNHDIGRWDLSEAIEMKDMLWNANAFDQNIQSWRNFKIFDDSDDFGADIGFTGWSEQCYCGPNGHSFITDYRKGCNCSCAPGSEPVSDVTQYEAIGSGCATLAAHDLRFLWVLAALAALIFVAFVVCLQTQKSGPQVNEGSQASVELGAAGPS
jgi:hypothetical protein